MKQSTFPHSRPLRIPVAPGDSLQAIAVRILGDESRWPELASVNGLVWPYLNFEGPNGTPHASVLSPYGKVFGAGDLLAIPMPWTAAPPPEDPIGVDLRENGMKHELVRGRANLAGALLRRLRTPRRYLPHHPGYGSRLRWYLGRPSSVANVLAIRREVASTLLQDPRVLAVVSVTAELQVDAVRVAATVKTPLGLVEVAGDVSRFVPDPVALEVPNG